MLEVHAVKRDTLSTGEEDDETQKFRAMTMARSDTISEPTTN